jgi:hypothetical protein
MFELRLELRKQERVRESQRIVGATDVELLPRHEHRPGLRARVSVSALRTARGHARIDPDQAHVPGTVELVRGGPLVRFRTVACCRSIRHDWILKMKT